MCLKFYRVMYLQICNPIFYGLSILNDSLTANNGTTFRFGYDSESDKYGYYVTDSEGADTLVPFKASTPSLEYTYIQDAEGKIPELTYDYDYDTVSVITITGSRSRTLWTKSNPTTCYVHVTGSQFTYTSAVVTLDTENKKITFSGIGYSYGKNNGDPSHTIYICP